MNTTTSATSMVTYYHSTIITALCNNIWRTAKDSSKNSSGCLKVTENCIIIIIIERKYLGGVMSKDCKDTLQTLKTVTKRECDAK